MRQAPRKNRFSATARADDDDTLRRVKGRYFSHFANHVREWPGGMPFSSPNGS